jgi:hypothetical protein
VKEQQAFSSGAYCRSVAIDLKPSRTDRQPSADVRSGAMKKRLLAAALTVAIMVAGSMQVVGAMQDARAMQGARAMQDASTMTSDAMMMNDSMAMATNKMDGMSA